MFSGSQLGNWHLGCFIDCLPSISRGIREYLQWFVNRGVSYLSML